MHNAWPTLDFFLALNGYTSHRLTTVVNGCGGSGFGIAAFWLGGCGNGGQCRTSPAYYSQNDGQSRGYICGRGAFPDFTACSTHMSVQDSIARLNVNEYFAATSWFSAITPITFAMGDFNVQPEVQTDFYGGWREADPCELGCSNQRTHDLGEKLDYIFAKNRCRLDHPQITTAAFSDHRIVTGFFGSC